jgi:hypothetical protein
MGDCFWSLQTGEPRNFLGIRLNFYYWTAMEASTLCGPNLFARDRNESEWFLPCQTQADALAALILIVES